MTSSSLSRVILAHPIECRHESRRLGKSERNPSRSASLGCPRARPEFSTNVTVARRNGEQHGVNTAKHSMSGKIPWKKHPFLDDFHVKKIKKVYLQVTTGPISACSRHNASANSNMACSWRKELRARWQGVAKPLRITKARLLVSTTRPKKPAKMVTLKGLNSWLNDVQPIRKKTKPPKGSFLEWRYPIPPKKGQASYDILCLY